MFVSTVAPLSFTGKGANLNIVIAPEECRAGRQGIEGGGENRHGGGKNRTGVYRESLCCINSDACGVPNGDGSRCLTGAVPA